LASADAALYSTGAALVSTDRSETSDSKARSWPWRPPLTARATGWQHSTAVSFAFGDAASSVRWAHPLEPPIVGMASTQDGKGYWLVAADGGIFAFAMPSSTVRWAGTPLSAPVTGMAPTAGGHGYWLVAADGGSLLRDAPFFGSTGGTPINNPVVGNGSLSSRQRLPVGLGPTAASSGSDRSSTYGSLGGGLGGDPTDVSPTRPPSPSRPTQTATGC